MPILNWLTRASDIGTARRAPYRLLEEASDLSAGDPGAGNMLIQGDNLEALKALLPFYAGQVKCIYIDPPYNTRSAFEHYDDNLEHTRWLGMMWPRLELLRDLPGHSFPGTRRSHLVQRDEYALEDDTRHTAPRLSRRARPCVAL